MELEYHGSGSQGKLLIVAGVILALVAGGTSFYVLNSQQQSVAPSDSQRQPAVVATRPITARTTIEAADVAVRQVAIEPANAAGILDKVDLVIGRIPAVAILPGQLVTENLLAVSETGGAFSILGPTESIGPDSEAWRAVSLTVPSQRAVGGFLEVGQIVDVFATANISVPGDLAAAGRYFTDKSTKIIFQNMLILARQGDEYVVRATLSVAEEILHLLAGNGAVFSMALRPDIDIRISDATTLGTTTTRIISKYGLPIPEVYPPGTKVGPTLPPKAP
jgi:Flp pilus assembly protein CpaB